MFGAHKAVLINLYALLKTERFDQTVSVFRLSLQRSQIIFLSSVFEVRLGERVLGKGSFFSFCRLLSDRLSGNLVTLRNDNKVLPNGTHDFLPACRANESKRKFDVSDLKIRSSGQCQQGKENAPKTEHN